VAGALPEDMSSEDDDIAIMTTRTVTMDLLIRMMTMILGMVAAHLLRLGYWIRWPALSRIFHP
jgi:hypothetical protein